jgi:hypothetical protein
LADFHEISYGRHAIGDCSKLTLFSFLQQVQSMSRMLKVVRWDADYAITNELRMRITGLTQPNLTLPNLTKPNPFTTDIRLHAFDSERMV